MRCACFVLGGVLAACTPTPSIGWSVSLSDPDRTAFVVAEVFEESCSGVLVERTVIARGESGEGRSLPLGTYCLSAYAVDVECTRFASDREVVGLDAQRAPVELVLELETPAPQCELSECRHASCTSIDAGMEDAGMDDAGTSDAGTSDAGMS